MKKLEIVDWMADVHGESYSAKVNIKDGAEIVSTWSFVRKKHNQTTTLESKGPSGLSEAELNMMTAYLRARSDWIFGINYHWLGA
jgi:hypothetical protein